MQSSLELQSRSVPLEAPWTVSVRFAETVVRSTLFIVLIDVVITGGCCCFCFSLVYVSRCSCMYLGRYIS